MKRITHTPELGGVTKHNAKQLRILNEALFPVSYNDKFYTDVLEMGNFAKLGVLEKHVYYSVVRTGHVVNAYFCITDCIHLRFFVICDPRESIEQR